MAALMDGDVRSMRDEDEPADTANNEDHRSGDEYLLQDFHIESLSE